MIAVIAIELMPEALSVISGWTVGVAFSLGGIAYIGIEMVVEKVQSTKGKVSDTKLGMWMIYIAVAIDLFSDGLLIGTGSAVSLSMAVVLALGQVLADVPEGYATIANMKGHSAIETDGAISALCRARALGRGTRLLLAPWPKRNL